MTAFRRRADQLFIALCLGWIAVHLAAVLVFGYGRDQGIYAYVAKVMLEGGMPYRDAWDFKPPGIFFIYTLTRALLGDGMWAIRLVEVLGLAGMVVAMTRFTRLYFGDWRPGLAGGALAIALHAQLDFWHTAQPESFGGMLLICALVTAARPTPRRLVLCGMIFGFIVLLKPTMGGAAVVVALWRAWESWRVDATPRALLPPVLIFAGAAVPIALCLAWLGAGGALGAAREIFTGFAPAYTKLGWARQEVLGFSYYALLELLTRYSSVMFVGLGLALAMKTREDRRGATVLALILVTQVAGVIAQAKLFPYHWGAAWPVLGMLAGLGWWRLSQWLAERGPLSFALGLSLLVVLTFVRTAGFSDLRYDYTKRLRFRLMSLVGALPQATRDELDSIYAGDGTANLHAGIVRETARRIRSVVGPDRTLYVWGFEPTLHVVTDLRAPTRYFYNEPLRMALTAPATRPELMAALASERPAAIVLHRRDFMPRVVGDHSDSAGALATFPELKRMIDWNYTPFFEMDYLVVMLDKTLAYRAGLLK